MSLRYPLWAVREAWRALAAPMAGAQEDLGQAEGLPGSLEVRLPLLEVVPFGGVAVPEPEAAPGQVAMAGRTRGGAGSGAGVAVMPGRGEGLQGPQAQQDQRRALEPAGESGRRRELDLPSQQGRVARPGGGRGPESEGGRRGAPEAFGTLGRAAEAPVVPRLSLRRGPGPGVGSERAAEARQPMATAVSAPVAPRPVLLSEAAPVIPAAVPEAAPAPVRTAEDLLVELTRELWARAPHPPTPSPIAPPATRERGRPLPTASGEASQELELPGQRREMAGRPELLRDRPMQENRRPFEESFASRPDRERGPGLPDDAGRGFPLSRTGGRGWERGPLGEGPDEARRLADLVNDALVEQARRHGVDLS